MDYVDFNLAKKLKEKGFKTENTAWYYLDGNLVQVKKYVNISPYEYAPTISQVLKFLREEKKIYIVISVNPTLSTKDKIAYYYQVYSNYNGVTSDYYESEECYAQWEECAIDSIKYVLDNLI